MIEPRAVTIHVVQSRREPESGCCDHGVDHHTSPSPNEQESLEASYIAIEEPERPIHPGLEYEVLIARDDVVVEYNATPPSEPDALKSFSHKDLKLLLSFILLVISGTGNFVMVKLQAIPMYNYPNFLNIFTNLMYIPICFAYIIPTARYGWFQNSISTQQLNMSKRPFVIMGFLDCLSFSMQVFASVYLPGPLLVLLPQAAIPISMILSRYLLKERNSWLQYAGAILVLVGVSLVLEPVITQRRSPDYYCEAINLHEDCTICNVEVTQAACLSHRFSNRRDPYFLAELMQNNSSSNDDPALCQWVPFEDASRKEEVLRFVWSLVVVASTIPMTISAIYKQKVLGDGVDIDPIFLNGWIAVFQFLFSLVLAVPAGLLSSPSIRPLQVPDNLLDGLRCFAGHGSIHNGCHPDTMCEMHAALYVSLFLCCNVFYAFFMLLILKYGSSSLLFMAITLMVPLSNVAFSLPFMPESAAMHLSDISGLLVIMTGIVLYRFADKICCVFRRTVRGESTQRERVPVTPSDEDGLTEPLLRSGDI